MKKEQIILIGGGGHCKSCIDVIELGKKFIIKGIVDLKENIGTKILNYPIIACDNDLEELVNENKYFLITIGQLEDSEKRETLFNKLKRLGAIFPIIISPLAYVSKYASTEEGTIIMHQALVNSNAQIGKNCIINTKSLIEHDAQIGNNCHISTGAIVNGGVKIGNNVFYGSGAVSKEYISIPDNSFIKANSIVK